MTDTETIELLIHAVESDVNAEDFEVSDYTVHTIGGLVHELMTLRNDGLFDEVSDTLGKLSKPVLELVAADLMYELAHVYD